MKAFRINDCDTYCAETLEQAIDFASEESNIPVDEICDRPRECDLDTEMMYDCDLSDVPRKEREKYRITLREAIRRRVEDDGWTPPFMLCSTEY